MEYTISTVKLGQREELKEILVQRWDRSKSTVYTLLQVKWDDFRLQVGGHSSSS